ncbi:MAG: glycoside hydrolase family 127 protein [Bacteroidales bacterium]|nr:glycoside hydrolase family 127 protein [Bacteroidales bacterium]
MKNVIYSIVIILAIGCGRQQSSNYNYPITAVGIRNVVIDDSFWLPKIRIIQDSTIQYAFAKCQNEGRMENFLIAGGKKQGKTHGKMPFDDTDLYKIIEGASYSLISSPNPILDQYLDSIISIIKTGQEPDGYITTWFTIDPLNPPASWVKPSHKRWENEVSSHELYNSGHLFEAASAHYLATGKRNFLDIALKNADLLVENFGPGKLACPPGHQIVETGLIKLYSISNNLKYLELARFFLDIRGDSLTHPLYGEYSQDHLPVIRQDEVVGHAVRGIYMYAGMTDIAAIYHETNYLEAIYKLWDNMVNKKMYITGGLGSRHEGEAFGEDYELPNLTAYGETCAAIGSVYWNQRLHQLTGDSKYYDIIERTLYNGLISGISLSGKEFFYPNPLESDGIYSFNHGTCTRQSWFDCSCCPTNLIRFLPFVPELIYSMNKDSVYVNLYISNNAHFTLNDNEIEIIQQTNYPLNGEVQITMNPKKKSAFTLKLRLPGWAGNKPVPGDLYTYMDDYSGKITLKINGKEENLIVNKGYIEISRTWIKGDKVELTLPMAIRKVITNTKVQDNLNKVAFEYGPIVYCGEEIDNNQLSEATITQDAALELERKAVLNEHVNLIKIKSMNKELTLIPYYLWSNRGTGKMKVWFPLNESDL